MVVSARLRPGHIHPCKVLTADKWLSVVRLRSGALRSYVLGVNRQLGGAITAWPFSFVSQRLCAYFSVAVHYRINNLRPTPTTSGSCVDTLYIIEFDEVDGSNLQHHSSISRDRPEPSRWAPTSRDRHRAGSTIE
ncbi:hypothetical protein OIE68_32025 [Nocardia vinacea]|uniref:hypothetical protein n=1 Tax=Nocardia vinacea TaxID=96468 RepID=UPI002E148B8E|nr:hypothetical protein OIE68_32025 [Nocardia vinacea]